jgi:hypothetical protein
MFCRIPIFPTTVLIIAALAAPGLAKSRGSHSVPNQPPIAASVLRQSTFHRFMQRPEGFGSFGMQRGPRMMQWEGLPEEG